MGESDKLRLPKVPEYKDEGNGWSVAETCVTRVKNSRLVKIEILLVPTKLWNKVKK